MRRWVLTCLVAAAVVPGRASSGEEPGSAAITRDTSYSIGYQVGGDFRRQGVHIDVDTLVQGVLDALSGSEPRMTRGEMRRTLAELQRTVEALEREGRDELARRNLQAAEAFLAENGARPDVRTLESGLQYRILEQGSGRSPGPSDSVALHYRGTRIDGTEFESSRRRDEPPRFRLDEVMPGWREALLRMREGDRWELFVPPALAHGAAGNDLVEPNSALIFEIDLISVHPGQP